MTTNLAFEESQVMPAPVSSKDQRNSSTENERVYSYEEAVTLARVGLFHYFLQLVCGMCLLTGVTEMSSMGIVMPFIDLPATTGEISLLSSAGFLGMILSMHAVGFLSDTWGRTKTLRTTLSISFLTSFASVFSINIWMLIVLRFLTGFIMSASQASVYNLVGEFHSSKTRAKYVTMLSIFPTLAMIFMPVVAMLVLPLKLDANMFGLRFASWRCLMLIFTFMRIFGIGGLLLIPETPKYTLIHDDHDATIRTMQLIYSKNTGHPKSEYPVRRIANDEKGGALKNVHGCKDAAKLIWSQTVPMFYRIRVLHTLNFSVVMFIVSAVAHGTNMWIPTIIKKSMENTVDGLTTCDIMENSSNVTSTAPNTISSDDVEIDTDLFKILIIIGIVLSILYLMLSLIITAIGKRTLLVIMIIVPAISCLTMQFVTSFPWAVVNLTILISMNNCSGIIGTMIFEFFPTNICGMAMNLILMIARIGSAVGCSVLGIMIHNWCNEWFDGSFGLCLLLLILAILLPIRKVV